MINIDNFNQQKECLYKGEKYAVRDNGAILRYPHNQRIRSNDNQWTFGKPNEKTGYMEIAGERVHRIVATAFYGEPPTKEHVVDHIDTNKRNNRVENLHWVTKLENVLFNPITAKRIEVVCGSVEAFLENPSKFRDKFQEPNYAWMCTVNADEAKASLERLLEWAKSDKKPSGGVIGEWIYRTRSNTRFVLPFEQEEKTVVENETATTLDFNQSSQRVRHRYYDMPKYLEEFSDYATSGAVRFKTKGEILGAIQSILKANISIMLPELVLSTCGSGILVEKARLEQFDNVAFIFEGKARTTNNIVLKKGDYRVGVVVLFKGLDNKDLAEQYASSGADIFEIDLTWAKEGLSEAELVKAFSVNSSKKKWLFNKKLASVAEKLLTVCEPIQWSSRGVLHSYVTNCPLMTEPYNGRNGVQDMDCWYCDYSFQRDVKGGNEKQADLGMEEFEGAMFERACFGKARIETYDDLLSVVDVVKKDKQIVGITFNRDSKITVKEFDFHSEDLDVFGKTLLELWDERTGDKIVAHNVISDWYVLIDENPHENLKVKGSVYAKISKSIEGLEMCRLRSIFGHDNKEWEVVKKD